jgi:toxin ParE1/3/4
MTKIEVRSSGIEVSHFQRRLTTSCSNDAQRDLEDIYIYIFGHDSLEKANYVLKRVEDAAAVLRTNPKRGSYPQELGSLGIREYRQILFKPYRLIYRAHDRKVVIYMIADGRRDLQSLLSRRLLSQA